MEHHQGNILGTNEKLTTYYHQTTVVLF